MQQPLGGALDALENALDRNRISWSSVAAVVTIGGGARHPVDPQRLSEQSRVVVTTPQPALDAAIGAALSAAFAADSGADRRGTHVGRGDRADSQEPRRF